MFDPITPISGSGAGGGGAVINQWEKVKKGSPELCVCNSLFHSPNKSCFRSILKYTAKASGRGAVGFFGL